MADAKDATSHDNLLLAIVALLVDARADTEREAQLKSEVLLAGVGLSPVEIAQVVRKQPSAVRMTLSRARKGAG
jgi:DNA-directed RNA polymerase specialized sigma24 family protein